MASWPGTGRPSGAETCAAPPDLMALIVLAEAWPLRTCDIAATRAKPLENPAVRENRATSTRERLRFNTASTPRWSAATSSTGTGSTGATRVTEQGPGQPRTQFRAAGVDDQLIISDCWKPRWDCRRGHAWAAVATNFSGVESFDAPQEWETSPARCLPVGDALTPMTPRGDPS